MPSIVFDQTYNWSGLFGNASIQVTVTEGSINGDDVYDWEYSVTNDSGNFWDIGYFALPAIDPDDYGLDGLKLTIGNLESTVAGEWTGEVGNATDRPLYATDEYIWWKFDSNGIEPGQSAVFSFTTAPTTISSGQGITKETTGFAPTILGTIAAPEGRNPRVVSTKADTEVDDGVVSLREAVDYVLNNQNKPTTVSFDINGPVTLAPGKDPIELGKTGVATSILIDGPLQGTQTIQRSGEAKGLFHVPAMATVELNQLMLREGNSSGGAVNSSGTLKVTSCSFIENGATGGLGGAVYASSGTLIIDGSSAKPNVFTGNSAAWGGAIYIGMGVTANIKWSEFTLNSATSQGGAIFIDSSTGQNYTTVTLINVDINGNLCSGSRGGGIMVSDSNGAGTWLTMATTQIRNNIVSGTSSKGGGVFFGAGVIDLLGVTFQENDASTGDGLYMVTGSEFFDDPDVDYINDTVATGTY